MIWIIPILIGLSALIMSLLSGDITTNGIIVGAMAVNIIWCVAMMWGNK